MNAAGDRRSRRSALRTARGKGKTKVLLWGPMPHRNGVFGGGIGGYARCNSQMLKTYLASEFDMVPLAMTVPRFRTRVAQWLHLAPRLLTDMARVTYGLIRHRPDVLHITALYYRSIYREAFATWLARRMNIAVYYDVRAGKFEDFVTACSRFDRWLLGGIMRNADEVAVEGRRCLEFVRRAYGREAAWVPNFFLREDFARFPAATLERPEAEQAVRLAFVGYLIPDKGIDVLLEAGYRLSRDRPVEITLIGQRSSRAARVLSQAEERQDASFKLNLTGRLELHELLAVLRQQHLFVFLSRFKGEGHSNAVTEAMAVGLPILSTDNGFLADVVTPECGVVLPKGVGAAEAYQALKGLLADWPALQAMGEASRKRIALEFNESVVLEPTAVVYRKHGLVGHRSVSVRPL